ncbi:sigma 54-interacting transcriptional regulator [Abyssisolibacter fermentans]|uniref:sigma 54-interacting transcriptional regulator n=1 Tax=Abyssisolibacter fermentans TaxID=1766203 RepID=UPI000834A704|nr:sigma 54-interacting transcriptional regulator [Abyssisolibacter fermentans]
MKDKILKIIETEDKKNPLTDNEIAQKLNINRSEVVKLRHELNIQDSRERRKELLLKYIKRIVANNPNISERVLTNQLNDEKFKISRRAVSQLLKLSKFSVNDECIVQKNLKKTNKQNEVQQTSFAELVGAYGSLKPKVELAKAAVLYPPNGLHTLICGPTGVGKSELAECMYNFAIESSAKDKDAPFIVFNCADYAENPQLLLAQLFGYMKGAYTGAESEKEGIVEKADGGILFLDEIHRLPPEGQEILFYLIDKGKFRRLGETASLREVKIMIIGATTEDIESSLLGTFRRRIPMTIKLPSLDKRPLQERYKIIEKFFKGEATRINTRIVVSNEVLVALLLYDARGNVGQLRSDIQVACARGFLKYIAQKNEAIEIDIPDLPSHVARGLLNINEKRDSISSIVDGNLEIYPSSTQKINTIKDTAYMLPEDIYKEIEYKYQKYENQGIDIQIINRIIGDELETKVQQLVKQIRYNKRNLIRQDLQKIVGEKIISAVDIMLNKAKKELNNIDDSLFYCLATHLSAAYERILQNKQIVNPQLKRIKDKYPKEYAIADNMAELAGFHLKVNFPKDEVAFLAMYLKAYSKDNYLEENHVGVVILTHGHVAEGMVNVANRLLGEEHAKAIEMSLDESPKKALLRAEEAVKQVDRGKGVLFLVDMGSLVSFANLISEKTNIPIRTIPRVDTLMVIEASRKAVLPDADLNELADSIEMDKFGHIQLKYNEYSKNQDDVIISLCLTGEGAAKVASDLILKYFPEINGNVELINIGILTNDDFITVIRDIMKRKNVLAIVGTINPKIPEVPYISMRKLIKENGALKLKKIIESKNKIKISYVDSSKKTSLKELIREDLIMINPDIKTKKEVLAQITEIMEKKGYVTDKFLVSIHQREILAPTVINGNIAIPHGNTDYVIKQCIGIVTLNKPIEWCEGFKVDLIFMLALNTYSKDKFKKLYKILNDENIIKKIKASKSAKQLKEVITDD